MVRFKYNQQLSPPAPIALVRILRLDGFAYEGLFPAQVDSGADCTVIPAELAEYLQLSKAREVPVGSLDGSVCMRATSFVTLKIHDLSPITVEAVQAAGEEIILLGRDVLNHFLVTLDGPRQLLSFTEVNSD